VSMRKQPDARSLLTADRAATLDRLAGLDRELTGMVEAAQGANADDEHDPEGATLAFEREHSAALAGHAREQLAAIDAALRRLDVGSYGTCVMCGAAIGGARLAARPAAATCITCAARPR
jgi:DnaK suppressor protein